MDPYYQGPTAPMQQQAMQQQQQPQQSQQQQQQMMAGGGQIPPPVGSRGGGPMGDAIGHQMQANPSAPSMHQPISGQQQQPVMSSGGRGYAQSSQQQAAGYMLDPQQQQQQQQQLGQMQPMGQAVMAGGGGGGHHSSRSQAQHGHHSSSSRHYGGGGSHRSAMAHQHRSSAAAISDPMLASGITDHLASASGPLTGSGGALNQLGGPGYYPPRGATGPELTYNPSAQDWGSSSGAPIMSSHHHHPQGIGSSGHHQSRYDTHYGGPGGGSVAPRSSRTHHSYSGAAQHLSSDQAFQLSDPLAGDFSMGRHYGQQHQSLGNLPSAVSGRYGLSGLESGLGSGVDRYGQPVDMLGPAGSGLRAGSMPAEQLSSARAASYGLGAYNPLDDPLASVHQSHLMSGPAHSLRHSTLDPMGYNSATQPQQPLGGAGGLFGSNPANRDAYVTELRARLLELQGSYVTVKRELETATQKLGSSMHSIKSFWSPELKKERALRKEEQTKYALINDQMKLMRVEVQKQAILIRQLEDELRLAHETSRLRATDPDIQQHIDALCMEKENLFKENTILRDHIRELEMRVETQKQTLAARDDSIKKMVEMMNNKGIASKMMEEERMEMDRIKTRNIELEARLRHYETIIESKEKEIIKIVPDRVVAQTSHQQKTAETIASSYFRPNCMSPLPPDSTNDLQAPKSPIPKQRKSLMSNSQSSSGGNQKQSKVERLKDRLAAARAASSSALPSKEHLNELILKNSNISASLSSSSSGVSSSRSLEYQQLDALAGGKMEPLTSNLTKNKPEQLSSSSSSSEKAGELPTTMLEQQDAQDRLNRAIEQSVRQAAACCEDQDDDSTCAQDYKLCQCHGCQSSGQEIYSRNPNEFAFKNQRKAVSFRPNVEHIGSPSYRLLNDYHKHQQQQQQQQAVASMANNRDYYYYQYPVMATTARDHEAFNPARGSLPRVGGNRVDDSCDSLHATKDFSLVNQLQPQPPHPSMMASHHQPGGYELRPLDCSTPLTMGPHSGTPQVDHVEGRMAPAKGFLSRPDTQSSGPVNELLVMAEVHEPGELAHGKRPTALVANNSNYTCLCSPDFMCVHNYPALATLPNSHVAAGRSPPAGTAPGCHLQQSNDQTYQVNSTKSDYALSSNCIECKNLSTYVNLSSDRLHDQACDEPAEVASSSAATKRDRTDEHPAKSHQLCDISAVASLTNGYDSGEYKRLIQSKQFEVYGPVTAPMQGGYAQQGNPTQSKFQPLVFTGDNAPPSVTSVAAPRQEPNLVLDEQMHYLSEARRLSEYLNNCSICSEQLAKANNSSHTQLIDCDVEQPEGNQRLLEPLSGSDEPECQCNAPLDNGQCQRQQTSYGNLPVGSLQASSSSSTLKSSYHTASSSLPANVGLDTSQIDGGSSHQKSHHEEIMCLGDRLEVLPLTTAAAAAKANQPPASVPFEHNSALKQQHSTMMMMNNSQMDSSLSSLFVYRHPSDNENVSYENQYDPDSLEMSRQPIGDNKRISSSAIKQTQTNKQTRLTQQQQLQQKQSGVTGWLKPRPRSDYIPLSSATSSLTNAAACARMDSKRKDLIATEAKFIQVDPDLSQSSIVKRRQLQHGQSLSSKKKLLASKSASQSSPNISTQQAQQTAAKRSSLKHNSRLSLSANNSSSSASQVKSIYQCVKNHLLDITSSSGKSTNGNSTTASNSSSSKFGGSPAKQTSASLPKNSSLASSLGGSGKKSSHSKSVQMEELRNELSRRDQEMLTVGAKMKALEDQQRDSQRHIRVLKDSLVAKEEHYNLLLADVEELRRNLDERNKLIDRRSYQQTFQTGGGNPLNGGGAGLRGQAGNQPANKQLVIQQQQEELQEMHSLLDMRDKRISELQRKLIQLENHLVEREAQLAQAERAKMRLEHGAGYGESGGGGGGGALLNHLEETLNDKEKQISLLRDQRDRAEHELNEERDAHERIIKEYKAKLNSVKFEMEKLQNRLSKSGGLGSNSIDYAGQSYSASNQQDLVKRLELDKRSLQLECERLKDKLDSLGGRAASSASRIGEGRTSSALGDYSVVEFERLQEALESQKQELRRAQAECRMNEMERKRTQDESDKLSERCERLSSEMHKLKAKFENTTSERDQILEDYERQQQMISKCQTERDCALADINQIKLEHERLQQAFNKCQLETERLQAQLERAQHECRKLDERRHEEQDELRQLQADKSAHLREFSKLELAIKTAEMQQKRLQQERDLTKQELDRLRERYDRLESEMERCLQEKELAGQQGQMYKERLDQHQSQLSKLQKERDQVSLELEDARERLHKLQKLQDTSEHETRQEVRLWKEKYERLLAQYEKVNEDIVAKHKEYQLVMEKLQRAQSDNVKLEAKLEQCEMDKERLMIEVEKCQAANTKAKDDNKKWSDELGQLQEMYTKTNTKLLNLIEIEERLRIDYEKCQMDLEVLRERYEKLQLECRKLQQERDRLQVEHERLRFDSESQQLQQQQRAGLQAGQAASSQQANQASQQQLSNELERTLAKLDQYQREINKLQLEKERLILDSKAALQQIEQQHQQTLLKIKSNEEKLLMELERSRLQLDKVQSKCEQTNVDQEKLLADKERLQQQLLLLQQEVDKFRNQQSNSVQETKRLHDEEMQRVLQELETIREKYTQQRKELLQLRELQQNHSIDKDILERELEAAESRLEKLNQNESKQRQDSERCLIEIEKLKDKFERKQQELTKTQKERDQFAQEIQVLHRQIQQLQLQFEQHQQQQQQQHQQQQSANQQAGGQQVQPQQQQVKPDEINKLKQMLVKSENELQKTMAENQRLQMEVERLKLQLADAAEYIGKVENDNKMILEQMKQQQAADQQKNQQKDAQQKAQQQQQQQPNQQQRDLEMAQQEMKKMQEVIKKSAQEIQRIHDEKTKIQDANKEIQRALEKAKSDFDATLEQYEHELDRLQKENQQREQQLREQQQKQQQQTGNQQAQQQPQQPQQQQADKEYKAKLEKAVEAINAYQKTVENMKREIVDLNKRNMGLNEQNQALNENLRATEEQLKRAQTAVQQQQQQANNNNEPNSGGAGQQVDEMRQQVAKLSEVCTKLEKELTKSREETQQHAQANQQLKQAVDKSQADLSGLKSERDRYQQQLEKLLVELERREDEMANLQSQQDKSGQNLQSKQSELQNYQKQLEEREKALEAKRQELNNLSKQIQQQQQQSGGAQGQAPQQQQELVNKLQQQIKNLEEERTKLRGELERVRNELKQAQAELERLLKILSASEEEKFNLTQQIDQLQAKLRSAPTQQQQQQQQPAGAQSGPRPPLQQQQQQQVRGPPPPRQGAPQPQQQGQPRQQPPPSQQQQPRQPPPQGSQQRQPRPANPQQAQQQRPPAQQIAPGPTPKSASPLRALSKCTTRDTSASPDKDPDITQRALDLRENLDLLELALERSIQWSLSNRLPSLCREAQTGAENEQIDEVRDIESHVRAFITRFKIELNQLMSEARSLSCGSSEAKQFSFEDEEDDDEDDDDSFSDSLALTEGVYKISEDVQLTTTDDERPGGRERLLVGPATVDDGYRSLSRDSTQPNKPGKASGSTGSALTESMASSSSAGRANSSFVERQSINLLIQQLNDIRSRVVDLVHELDQIAERPHLLEEDELDAYRRRRDALVMRVDQLIEGQRNSLDKLDAVSGAVTLEPAKVENSRPEVRRETCLRLNSSPLESTTPANKSSGTKTRRRDYEEQVHVIDYDFNRRARDLSEIRRHEGLQSVQIGSARLQPSLVILTANEQPVGAQPFVMPKSTTMIELNAVMTDYERQRRELETDRQNRPTSLSSRTPSSASSSSFI